MIEIPGVDPRMIANNLEPYIPTHPGEVVKDDIEYRGMTQRDLAARMGISYDILNGMLNAKRPVTSEYALMFEAALGLPAATLSELQASYDMLTAKRNRTLRAKLDKIRQSVAML